MLKVCDEHGCVVYNLLFLHPPLIGFFHKTITCIFAFDEFCGHFKSFLIRDEFPETIRSHHEKLVLWPNSLDSLGVVSIVAGGSLSGAAEMRHTTLAADARATRKKVYY